MANENKKRTRNRNEQIMKDKLKGTEKENEDDMTTMRKKWQKGTRKDKERQ